MNCQFQQFNVRFNVFAYLIFVIFSPPIQFSPQFFSTQKRVNRNKTDYAKNSVNCHKTDFTTKSRVNFRFLHLLSCGEFWNLQIWEHFWFLHICCVKNLKFLYTWRNFRFLHICHVLKSEISPHDQFFLHLYIGDRGDKYEVWRQIQRQRQRHFENTSEEQS